MKGMMFLGAAILFEVFGSTMLKLSNGFTIVWPSVGAAAGFLATFTCLSFVLKTSPLSIAYATWAGIGTVCTALVGSLMFHENIHSLKAAGLLFTIVGIVILNTSQSKQQEKKQIFIKKTS